MTVTFTTGLMGSGKSKRLINQYEKETKMKRAYSSKFNQATGEPTLISSRNGSSISSISLNVNDIASVLYFVSIDIISDNQKLEAIYIDECQFMKKDLVSSLIDLCQAKDIDLHFFGLLTTFTGDYFEPSKFLLDSLNHENILNLHMVCQKEECENLARENARIVDGNIVRDGETFVENKSTYLALCLEHYLEE